MQDTYWPDIGAYIVEFNAESRRGSPRGIVLVCASMLDELLRRLLDVYFVLDANRGELFEGTSAPLGGFSARIKMAFALGLIPAEDRTRLNSVRKIRNEFAHRIGVDFSDRVIASLSLEVQKGFTLPGGDISPHGKFALAGIILMGRIAAQASKVHRVKPLSADGPTGKV